MKTLKALLAVCLTLSLFCAVLAGCEEKESTSDVLTSSLPESDEPSNTSSVTEPSSDSSDASDVSELQGGDLLLNVVVSEDNNALISKEDKTFFAVDDNGALYFINYVGDADDMDILSNGIRIHLVYADKNDVNITTSDMNGIALCKYVLTATEIELVRR